MTKHRVYIQDQMVVNLALFKGCEIIDNYDHADFIVIESNGLPAWLATYKQTHPLSPIIVSGTHAVVYEWSTQHHEDERLKQIIHESLSVVDRIKELPKEVCQHLQNNPYLAALAYLWTRNQALSPRLSSAVDKGYVYALSVLNIDVDAVLDVLVTGNYVDRQVDDTAYACPDCGSIQVLLRESCPHCKSVHIEEEALIHHFKCSHQGPESSFLDAQHHYTCPKCFAEIKHIGRDYDKPGSIYLCHACKQDFVDVDVRGKCLACQHEFSAQNSEKIILYRYMINNHGVEACFSNSVHKYNPKDILSDKIDILDHTSFYLLGKYFYHVEKRYHFKTAMLELDFTRAEQTLGAQTDLIQLITAVGREMSILLRKSDAATFNDNKLIMLLSGTDVEQAQLAKQRLLAGVKKSMKEEWIDLLDTSIYSILDLIEH